MLSLRRGEDSHRRFDIKRKSFEVVFNEDVVSITKKLKGGTSNSGD